jgi:very-short-patch-repair endonuclease
MKNKHKRKAQYKIKLKIVEGYADKLRRNLPKSEKWFLDELNKRKIEIPDLKSNEVFGLYIPDFIVHDLRLIIEIDGSIHEMEEIKERDKLKDEFYLNNGYKVIRVIAYSDESLIECLSSILDSIDAKKKSKKIINKSSKFTTKRINTMCYVCQTYKAKHRIEHKKQPVKVCGYCVKLQNPFKLA